VFSPVISDRSSSSSSSSRTFTLNSHTDDISQQPAAAASSSSSQPVNNADNNDNNVADAGDVVDSSSLSCTLDEVDVSRLLVVKNSPVRTSLCLSVVVVDKKANLHKNRTMQTLF